MKACRLPYFNMCATYFPFQFSVISGLAGVLAWTFKNSDRTFSFPCRKLEAAIPFSFPGSGCIMDGQAAARSIKGMLAYLAAIKAGGNLKDDEWLKTCLKHQVILEQQIAGCTGITLSQASEVITALVQAEAPDSFKSVLARAVLNKISGSTAGQDIQKQQCTHLEAFFTKRQWDEMLGTRPSDQHMFRVLSRLAISSQQCSARQRGRLKICALSELAFQKH